MVITIREYKNRGIYDAWLGDPRRGEWLCRSRTPALTAAHLLLERGADPAVRLEIWREGKSHFDLALPIAVAARLSVEQNADGKPTFVREHNHRKPRTDILSEAAE